jgi:foldase protein PrsA
VVRRPLLRIVALASALTLSACGDFFSTAAATVDGRKIDEEMFARQLDFLLADPRFAEQIPTGEQGELARKELTRNFLTFLIHQQVVRDFAEERDIDVSGQELNALLDQRIAEIGGRQAFEAQLNRTGATESDVRDLFEEELLRQRVAEAVVAQEVPESQLRQSYEQRALEFSRVHTAHILVPTEREAEEILRQATPQNFEDLARRFSEDTTSARNGGDLGTQRGSDFVRPYALAAQRIPVGEIGGPVETEFGFHVIHVIDRQEIPFEEARVQLLEEVRGQVFTEWLLGRVDQAEIRVNPRYGFFDEESGAVVERRSTTPEPEASVQVAP